MKNKILLIITIILSVPFGGMLGLFIGLMSTTFIPLCCDGNGCHNCFSFGGLIGYQATAVLGFLIGVSLIPISYIMFLVHLKSRSRKEVIQK